MVGTVLQYFDGRHDREEGQERRSAVSRDREQWHEEQRATDTHRFEDARHDQDLNSGGKNADVGLEVAVERGDEVAPRPRRERLRFGGHQLGQDEVARGADEAEDQHGGGDQKQIGVVQDQRESAPGVTLLGRAVVFAPAVFDPHPVGRVGHNGAAGDEHGRNEHQMKGMPIDGARGELRARNPADGPPASYHGEEALALLLGQHVVGQRPKLRDREGDEHPQPHEERASHGYPGSAQREESNKAKRKEAHDPGHEPSGLESIGEGPIYRDEQREQHRLDATSVTLLHGAATEEEERLSEDLEDVVGGQQAEQVREEEQDQGPLAVSDVSAYQVSEGPSRTLYLSVCHHERRRDETTATDDLSRSDRSRGATCGDSDRPADIPAPSLPGGRIDPANARPILCTERRSRLAGSPVRHSNGANHGSQPSAT